MIIFVINHSCMQPILRSSISPCYVLPNLQKIKNETHSSQPQQTCTKKQKSKNIQTQKNRQAEQWSHFLSRSNSSTRYVAIRNFLQQHAKAKRVASQPHNKKIVFIIFKMLMFTLVHFVLCPIAISVIILLKVNACRNENLFIYAYGYYVYPGCKHTCARSIPHETIVALITSLLCSLYPSSYNGVVCTSLYLRLYVVYMSSFYLIAVLPTTFILRTFARYSLFIFCIFYNALYILALPSSQKALLHSLQ